jgi:hypothetical protein
MPLCHLIPLIVLSFYFFLETNPRIVAVSQFLCHSFPRRRGTERANCLLGRGFATLWNSKFRQTKKAMERLRRGMRRRGFQYFVLFFLNKKFCVCHDMFSFDFLSSYPKPFLLCLSSFLNYVILSAFCLDRTCIHSIIHG